MGALLVTSQIEASGKTTIAAGIGQRLKGGGKKVGYLRVGGADRGRADAAFMSEALGLSEPPAKLQCDAGAVKSAYEQVSKGKDTVIIEGDWAAARGVAEATGAKIIVVAGYADNKSPVDAAEYKAFGDELIGVVINKVPANRLEAVSSSVKKVKLLGVIPEDRILLSPTVGELANIIKGEILVAKDKAGELVATFMLGITGLDRNPGYFGRKEAKAAILRTERFDLQLAALATPTSCLVLTGGGEASPSVLAVAETNNVPVIRVAAETPAVVDALEAALAGGRLAQEAKLAHLAAVMSKRFDFSAQ